MNHAKKMVLIPENTLERLQQRQTVNTAPLTSRLNGLDHDIQDVLSNEKLSEDEKVREYSQTLQNYLTYYNQRKSQPLKVNIEPAIIEKKQEEAKEAETEPPQEAQEQQQEVTLERDIIRALPKTLKDRGKLLMAKIKENPEIMKWDDRGELIFEGKHLKGSHISDLIGDSLRMRKGVEPVGWEMFTKGLAKMNAPEHLVRNTRSRNALREFKSGVKASNSKDKGEEEANDWFPTPMSLPKGPGPVKSRAKNPKKQIRQRWLTFHT